MLLQPARRTTPASRINWRITDRYCHGSVRRSFRRPMHVRRHTGYRPGRPCRTVGVTPRRFARVQHERETDAGDHTALGMAHVRRGFRARGACLCRPDARARPGERRDLPGRTRRRHREGSRRSDGHQGPARGRRERPRAVDAGHEGGIPDSRDRRPPRLRGAARADAGPGPSRVHARPVPRRAHRRRPMESPRSRSTSGGSATRSAAARPR